MRRKKYNKYNNRKTEVNGYVFDSKAEALRYSELAMLEVSGAITDLCCQPRYTLQEGFMYRGKRIRAITYIADFSYIDTDRGCFVVEDVKSIATLTTVFAVKRKLFLRLYGEKIDFRIVEAYNV